MPKVSLVSAYESALKDLTERSLAARSHKTVFLPANAPKLGGFSANALNTYAKADTFQCTKKDGRDEVRLTRTYFRKIQKKDEHGYSSQDSTDSNHSVKAPSCQPLASAPSPSSPSPSLSMSPQPSYTQTTKQPKAPTCPPLKSYAEAATSPSPNEALQMEDPATLEPATAPHVPATPEYRDQGCSNGASGTAVPSVMSNNSHPISSPQQAAGWSWDNRPLPLGTNPLILNRERLYVGSSFCKRWLDHTLWTKLNFNAQRGLDDIATPVTHKQIATYLSYHFMRLVHDNRKGNKDALAYFVFEGKVIAILFNPKMLHTNCRTEMFVLLCPYVDKEDSQDFRWYCLWLMMADDVQAPWTMKRLLSRCVNAAFPNFVARFDEEMPHNRVCPKAPKPVIAYTENAIFQTNREIFGLDYAVVHVLTEHRNRLPEDLQNLDDGILQTYIRNCLDWMLLRIKSCPGLVVPQLFLDKHSKEPPVLQLIMPLCLAPPPATHPVALAMTAELVTGEIGTYYNCRTGLTKEMAARNARVLNPLGGHWLDDDEDGGLPEDEFTGYQNMLGDRIQPPGSG